MAETTTVAASSPVEDQDPFNGQTPSLSEFQAYRQSGEVPARFKPPAESAPADTPEETVKPDAPESEPEDDQEPIHKGSGAEKRIKQLLAKVKELEAAQQAKPDVAPAPSPAPQLPPTRPKPTIEDKKADGTPKFTSYDEYYEELADWKAEQKIEAARQQQVQQQQVQKVQDNVEAARRRYGEDFDTVIEPTVGEIMGNKDIPMEVKRMMAFSDVLPELVFTIGSDQKTKQELVRLSKSDPLRAMRYIATLEVGIRQELAAPEPEEKEEKAPEPRKTSAPKPPAPVTGAVSRAFDVSDESLLPEDWMRKRNAQVARRRTG